MEVNILQFPYPDSPLENIYAWTLLLQALNKVLPVHLYTRSSLDFQTIPFSDLSCTETAIVLTRCQDPQWAFAMGVSAAGGVSWRGLLWRLSLAMRWEEMRGWRRRRFELKPEVLQGGTLPPAGEKGSWLLLSEAGASCNGHAWVRKGESWCVGMQAKMLFSSPLSLSLTSLTYASSWTLTSLSGFSYWDYV